MGFICSSSLLPAFAHYKMSRIDFSDIVNPGAVPSLNEGQVASIKIAFPSLREQRAIVDFLDTETAKINALIEGKRRLIELLEEKQQAVCARAVSRGLDPAVPLKASDVEWLGDVPAHWKVKRFKEVLREVDDGGVRILSSSTRQGIGKKSKTIQIARIGWCKGISTPLVTRSTLRITAFRCGVAHYGRVGRPTRSLLLTTAVTITAVTVATLITSAAPLRLCGKPAWALAHGSVA